MDARSSRLALSSLLAACGWVVSAPFAPAAEHRTANFVAYAPTPELAKEVAFTAEQWRKRLAKEWLGRELPNWSRPCPIQVKVGQIGAGGATTFNFDRGEVYGWRMNVQGTRERILDSVIPHEVSHTIFASHFRRPLPRWADEGAATLAEAEVEQRRQDLHLKQVWSSGKIPLQSLLVMKEYPEDMREVMTLYAQGYSLADYLVQKRGRARYLQFLDDGEKEGWEIALRKHYEIEGVAALEGTWGQWVLAGSPDLPADGVMVAGNDRRASDAGLDADPSSEAPTFRGQSPEADQEPFGPPAEPVVTASLDDDLSGFLPPADAMAEAESRTAAAPVDGKPARPAPLAAFRTRGQRRASVVTETADERPADGGRALPRATRVGPAADAGRSDFSDPTAGRSSGAPARPLGSTSRF